MQTATLTAIGDGMDPGFGVYVHWPFCAAKCPYCDFNSHVRHQPVDQPRFVSAFLKEMEEARELSGPRTVTSIFMGGGTPSLMEPSTVDAILQVRYGVNAWVGVGIGIAAGALVGAVIGALSFRSGLRGSYFALVTSGEPLMVQSALSERLHRHLKVLAPESEAYHSLVDGLGLREELAKDMHALKPDVGAYEGAVGAVMKRVYEERLKLTGQNGISDYDEGFTNFLWTFSHSSSARQPKEQVAI